MVWFGVLISLTLPCVQTRAMTVTIYDAWWSNQTDSGGDCMVPTSGSNFRLNWDPDVVGCVGTTSVFEKVYFKLSSSSTWTLYATTTPHTIDACSTADQQYLDITSGSRCTPYDYKIELYRYVPGQEFPIPDYTRDPSNDNDLSTHKEGAMVATIYDAWWSNQSDSGGGCMVPTSGSTFRLNWDPDVVGCSGSLSVFEKVYYKLTSSSTWTLYTTTTAHTINACSSADQQYVDMPPGSGCTPYDYKIEVYRAGQSTPDYTCDPSNDTDLSAHKEGAMLATIYNAWWSNQTDSGGGCMVPTNGSNFRLNWDPDVVGCSGSLSVFEKVYYKLTSSSTWTLYTTTTAHTINACSSADQQYVDMPPGSGCTPYDYKIEVYRAGQSSPDYTSDPSNDTDLSAHKEGLACLATCTVNPAAATNCAGVAQVFTASASGGTPPYSYLWNTGATTSNLTVSAVGTYTVTVSDAMGCTTQCSATLAAWPNPSCTVSPAAATNCAGVAQTFTASASGGTPPTAICGTRGRRHPTSR